MTFYRCEIPPPYHGRQTAADLPNQVAEPRSGFMAEYDAFRRRYPGAVVIWRIGAFDEVFGPDAERIAAALNFTLTTRRTGDTVYPMCGYPVHMRTRYTNELRRQGIPFVICERDADGCRTVVDAYDAPSV